MLQVKNIRKEFTKKINKKERLGKKRVIVAHKRRIKSQMGYYKK